MSKRVSNGSGSVRQSTLGVFAGALTLTLASLYAPCQATREVPVVASTQPRVKSSLSGEVAESSSLGAAVNAAAKPAVSTAEMAENVLPDAPVPQIGKPQPVNAGAPNQPPIAPKRTKFIPAGYQAQRLGVRGKIEVGATDLYSWEDGAAIVLSAGYEHVLNSQPNYGTNSAAFGQRVGAAAAREASQGVFTDMVFASLLHQDPRYYQLGPSRNPVKRTLYAITRPLITRTDGGRETINGSLLLGYGAAAALTPAYYPAINRNFHDTLSTYGGSIGGAALGFFVSEFSTDVLQALHLSHH